jgi:hypothetical protein
MEQKPDGEWDIVHELGRICVLSSNNKIQLRGRKNTYHQKYNTDSKDVLQVVSLFYTALRQEVKSAKSSREISLISVNSGDYCVFMASREITLEFQDSQASEVDVEDIIEKYISIIASRLNEAVGCDVTSLAGAF